MGHIEGKHFIQNDKSELKLEILKYLRKWPLFLFSTIIALILAWLYLRYTPPVYVTKSSLYVKIRGAKSGELMGVKDFQTMALPSGLMANSVDNELSLLTSHPLLWNVVKKVGLDVKVISKGRVKDVDLYEKSPVFGSILSLNNSREFKSKSYEINPFNKNGFKLTDEKNLIKGNFGVPVKTSWGVFVLNRNPKINFNEPLVISFINPKKIVMQLEASIDLSIPEKKSNIIELSRKETNPIRSERILNELMDQYNTDAIKDKNEEAYATANFIDERLKLITRELGGIENQKESFKEANKIADLQAQAQLNLQNASESTKKIMEYATQLEMVNSVLKMVNSSGNDQLLPSNLGMPSALDGMISDYNQLVLSRNRTLRQATNSNPAVVQFNKEITSLRELIKDNLKKSQANIQMSMGQTQEQMNLSKDALGKFPMQEKMFRSIERQQNLKEALFIYLLQKREETAIALSANTAKAKIVNPAFTIDSPVSPKKSNAYALALALGMLIPIGILYIVFALDTKIHNRRDIKKALSEIPFVGEIPNAGDAEDAVVRKNDLTAFAESFRIMLTNAKFIIKPIKGIAPVIMVSSSVKGEGKTTVSTNTALTLAQNRKVLLLGADLRNPQLKRFITHGKKGLSDYLVNENENNIEQYIETFKGNPNLDVLSSGTVPPNPTYLLSSDKMVNVFTELKSKYDYIIVDTAPLLLVSDSFHLIQYADLLLYVMRAEYTDRDILEFTEEVERDNAQGKLVIVLNDVKNRHISYYDNKYGYGYGYGKHNRKKK
jgi:capsular exopolysaccharide synthesis family protein